MKRTYRTTFKGYTLVLRSVLKLMSTSDMNFSKLGAYLCFVFQADWSRQDGHDFGCVLRDDAEIAKELGINHSTVSRARRQLIQCGLLSQKNRVTYITNLSMFEAMWVKAIAKSGLENPHEYFVKTPDELAKKLMDIAETQESQPKIGRQRFRFPIKSRLDVSNEDDIDIND